MLITLATTWPDLAWRLTITGVQTVPKRRSPTCLLGPQYTVNTIALSLTATIVH